MTAYVTRMPAGTPGGFSRQEASTIEAGNYDPANLPTAFGICMKLSSGKYVPLATSDAASVIVGFLVRPFPDIALATTENTLGGTSPRAGSVANIMKRGYPQVQMEPGAAAVAKGDPVYVRTTAATSPTRPVGGFGASGTGMVQVANAFYMGPADGSGITELAYNI